jgi:uncharacterized protein (DUF1810 family)
MQNLDRFLKAQASSYDAALREICAGQKRSHWIWYIFPQIQGLGSSPESRIYGLSGLEEAKEFLDHPVLGTRLREITQEVLNHADSSIKTIMGSRIDVMKLKSSMTLFDAVSPDDIFARVLNTFYNGARDGLTIDKLTK